jgi:hypothetical protein
MRNPKFLPVINGKNSEFGTRNAKNGTIKILTRIILLKKFSVDVFIGVNDNIRKVGETSGGDAQSY